MTTRKQIPLREFRVSDEDPILFEIGKISDKAGVVKKFFSKPNRINFYEILWITEGAGTRYIDFQAYEIRPNSWFFLTPGQVHYWDVPQPINGYVMPFQGDFLDLDPSSQGLLRNLDFFHRIDRAPVMYLDDEQTQVMAGLIDHLMKEYQTRDFGRAILLRAIVRILLIRLQRFYKASQPQVAPSSDVLLIDRFQQLIDQHYLNERNVQPYADMMGVTANYLTITAKQVLGQAAGTLIRNRVIMESKRLLAHTDQTIVEICHTLHFEDPSYFSRFFRREVGQSPTVFRQDFQKKYHSIQN